MINGNTQGIRQALLEQMETMQQIECERDEFLPEELMRQLARYTGLLGARSRCICRAGATYWT